MTIQHENYLLNKTTRRLSVMFAAMFALASCGGTSPERDQQGNRTHFDTTYEDLALCAMDAGVAPPYRLKGTAKSLLSAFPDSFFMEYSRSVSPDVVDRVNSCAVARKAARGGAAFVPKTTRDCDAVYHAKTADYAARRRQPGAQGGGLLGGLAKALVKGASESVVANAYRQCLRDIGAPVTAGIPKTSESISVAPTLNQPSARADISTTPTATICTGNSAIMVGGSDYCPR